MRERLEFGGKLIGFWSPSTRQWTRAGIRASHLMRAFGSTPGWDADTYDRLEFLGLQELWAWERKGRSWRIDKHTFNRHRVEKDYGHGRQYFVPAEFWTIGEADARSTRSDSTSDGRGGGLRESRVGSRVEPLRGARVPRPAAAGAC